MREADRWISVRYKGVEEAFALDRRKFVKGVGMAILAVQSRSLFAGEPVRSRADQDSGDGLVIQSGPGLFSHVHELQIPSRVLKAPPLDGIELTTSEALFHSHSVALTHEELRLLSRGGLVNKQVSSHVFAITLV